MEPPGGRRISPFRVTKRSTKLCRLSKTTRSRLHVQTVGLNAETKKCRHRADGEECLLTFPFIGLFRLRGGDSIGRCNTRSTPTCRELKSQSRLIQTKTLPCLGLHRL